jgi:Tol biopolymer transport system component
LGGDAAVGGFLSLRSRSALHILLFAAAVAGTAAVALGATAGTRATMSLRGTIALTGESPGGTPQVYLLHLASGKLSELTNGPGVHEAFGWSRDGSRLLVAGNGSGGQRLYSVRADGSSEVLLTSQGDGWEAEWSPDGKRVAFLASGGSTSGWLYVVKADGTHRHLLTRGVSEGGFFSGGFSWAPSGKRIVVARRHDLFTVTTSGRPVLRRIKKVQEYKPPLPVLQPAWSPDGTRIAFTEGESIAVIRPDGSHLRDLHDGHGPVWSPDGSRIAFRNNGDWVTRANGTGARSWEASWSGITFSPDSANIAYVGGVSHAPNGDVYAAHADGSKPVRVLHVEGLSFFLPLWRGGTATTESG